MGHPGGGRGVLLGGLCPGWLLASAQELAAVGELLASWGPGQYPPTARVLQPLQPACGGGTSDGSRGASAWSPVSFPVPRLLLGHRRPRQPAECFPLPLGLLDPAFVGPEPLPSVGSEAAPCRALAVPHALRSCSSVPEVRAAAGGVTAVCLPSRDRALGNPRSHCLGS